MTRSARGRVALSAGLGLAALTAALVVVAVRADDRDQLVGDGFGATEPCPAQLPVADSEPSVVAPPAAGPVDRLVPLEVPTAVTVCRYENASIFGPTAIEERPAEVSLEGERVLANGLRRLPDDLALPRGESFGGCNQAGGPAVPHLLRLDYPDGSVWLSTSTDVNSCAVVTNGAFTSATYVGRQVAASYDDGTWVPDAGPPGVAEGPCVAPPTGRAGQEQVFVPEGWDELVVCRSDGVNGTSSARALDDDAARRIVDLLLSFPTEPLQGFSSSCSQRQEVPGDDGATFFSLHVGYPQGRGVRIETALGCDPPLGNFSLSTSPTVEQQAELLRLLKGD